MSNYDVLYQKEVMLNGISDDLKIDKGHPVIDGTSKNQSETSFPKPSRLRKAI